LEVVLLHEKVSGPTLCPVPPVTTSVTESLVHLLQRGKKSVGRPRQAVAELHHRHPGAWPDWRLPLATAAVSVGAVLAASAVAAAVAGSAAAATRTPVASEVFVEVMSSENAYVTGVAATVGEDAVTVAAAAVVAVAAIVVAAAASAVAAAVAGAVAAAAAGDPTAVPASLAAAVPRSLVLGSLVRRWF